MTAVITDTAIVGAPVDRVDGPLKVTGAARYPSDVCFPDLAHAALVQSTIAAGTISGSTPEQAQAAPGVLAVITHQNAPAAGRRRHATPLGPSPRVPLQDNRILHYGQHVAVVVARTRPSRQSPRRAWSAIDYQRAEPGARHRQPAGPGRPQPVGAGS